MPETTPSDFAFTPAVKAQQEKRGSRSQYEKLVAKRPWSDRITPELATFIQAQNSVFFGTASAAGQPYIQHRGGPAGFLKLLGESRIGFANLRGNRQYISAGNLSENPRAYLFLIDYENARRVKFWGTARIVENDPELFEVLQPDDAVGTVENAILFDVAAWDVNCPQHIPKRVDSAQVASLLAERDARIAALKAELSHYKAGLPGT